MNERANNAQNNSRNKIEENEKPILRALRAAAKIAYFFQTSK